MDKEKLLINNPKSNNSEDMSNKQIEEMAKIIHKADENCREYFPISMSECLHKHGRFRTNAATELYNAGYRKQSEGEWIGIDICCEDMYCSVCGGIAPVDCEKEKFYKSNFCPNCGATMVTKPKGE